jgi:hypothetical protein
LGANGLLGINGLKVFGKRGVGLEAFQGRALPKKYGGLPMKG